MATQQQVVGSVVLSQASLASVLTGMVHLEDLYERAMRQMLADARRREAPFDVQGANGLRQQIIRAFGLAARPSEAMRVLAGQAGLDTAAAIWAEGEQEAATRFAQETRRRFGSTPIDATRHPPQAVEFLKAQRQTVANHEKVCG